MGDRYRRTARLAQGGMAELYAGVAYGEEGFRRPVAIKRMLPELAANELAAQMFMEEARLSMRLLHQNIVQVLDVGRSTDGLFLVMELVNGWDFDAILDAAARIPRTVPPALVAYTGIQVLSGLSFAYRLPPAKGKRLAAHRDVSASNVLVSAEGEIKVADFGIALVTEAQRSGARSEGFTGKYAYAAPEVIDGAPATAASDQFALGVLLYRMAAGRHPFGDLAPLPEFVERVMRASPPLVLGLPASLQGALSRMLAKDPTARFPSPETCAQALNAALVELGQVPSASAVADFLRSLPLPPPAFERAQLDAAPERLDVTDSAGAGAFELTSEFEAAGAELTADGTLATRAGSGPPRPTRRAAAQRPVAEPEPVLELAREEKRPIEARVEVFRDLPPETSKWPGRLVRLVLVLAVVGAGAWLWLTGRLALPLSKPDLSQRPSPVLFIDSEPSGAQVKLAGKSAGATPLVLDNTFPEGPVPIELSKKGYRTWKGTFAGGQAARVVTPLERR